MMAVSGRPGTSDSKPEYVLRPGLIDTATAEGAGEADGPAEVAVAVVVDVDVDVSVSVSPPHAAIADANTRHRELPRRQAPTERQYATTLIAMVIVPRLAFACARVPVVILRAIVASPHREPGCPIQECSVG